MTEITGTARGTGIAVEVFAGGALSSITLTEHALALGCRSLAAGILEAVAAATALANQRTRHALGLEPARLAGLGLACDAARTEQAEATTPATWRA